MRHEQGYIKKGDTNMWHEKDIERRHEKDTLTKWDIKMRH